MDEESFADLVGEYGLDDPDYAVGVDDSGIAFGQGSAEGEYQDIDDLIEEYENSSPSPPERRGVSNARFASNFNPLFTRTRAPLPLQEREEITGYEEPGQRYHARQQHPADAHAGPGLSNYRPPTFNTVPFQKQTASRPSFCEPAQGMALPPQISTPPSATLAAASAHRSAHVVKHGHDDVQSLDRGSNPRNAHGIRLRPVSELPDVYRGMFKFGVFNAVQSQCFDIVMHTNRNMVISAPTGSGKTVLFELAIIRMLMQSGGNSNTSKCIYIAPTKVK